MSSSSLNPSAKTFTPPYATGNIARAAERSPSQTIPDWFPQLSSLQEELILFIFSFVSDVPYEFSSTSKCMNELNFVFYTLTYNNRNLQSFPFLNH